MADETEQGKAQPAPKPAAPDPEIERARAETAQLRAQMNQVAEMVQSGRLVLKDQAAPTPQISDTEDDSALIDRKELRRHLKEFQDSAANVIVENATHQAKQTRVLAKESLRSKLKNFDKYEAEIDALLEKIPDPRVAASPETIRQVHKLVRSQHIDEEVEETLSEKKREWEDDLRAKGWTSDEIEEEVEERTEALREEASEVDTSREGTRQARPVARQAGVAPTGNASGARLASNRQRQAAPPLTREQRVIAEQFGIKNAEEWHKYGDPNYRHDSFGFHGKRKI